MSRDIISGPEDRAACSKCRTTPRGREGYTKTYTKLGRVSRGEGHVSKSPTSLRIFLSSKITENCGDNLAQDNHQSKSSSYRTSSTALTATA
ncbi:hypothetical protein F511_09013 [Dorcoceras hygrometricum]|uniref:Uncharacterized protein n=1 Tax=Dorcoceras hygrometricum TaxID=472368 RepID=A0A2Z7BKT3_9LAMI|nr:hypothetical protein F511_09013 [Dorcoceras hygrometricum]